MADRAAVQVGGRARVRWGESARRATVAVLGESTVEVIDDDDGEREVPREAVAPLEPFEATPPACRGPHDAGRLREEGNTLFRLQDHAAATERYAAALAGLGEIPQAGCPALASLDRTLWLGLAEPGERAEVGRFAFERPVGGGGLESGAAAPAARQVRLEGLLAVRPGDLGDMQRALLLNRARCWHALGSAELTVQDCNLALALLRALHGTALGKCPQACTALFLRGRARLRQGRMAAAEADLGAAEAAAEPKQLPQLAGLRRSIAEAKRSNRRLAKDIARWADASLEAAGLDAFSAAAADGLQA